MDNLAPIALLTLAALAWWVVMPLRAVLHDRKLETLADLHLDEPEKWPLVSVLVPARNEADTLEAAMQSLRQVDYPQLEIVIVDDRSSDGTAAIIERLAGGDPRIRSLRIDDLPEGWLGKVHALQRGLDLCSGEWVLFTDADIHFSPRLLKQAIACCLNRDRDFLTLLPDFFATRPLLAAAQAAFATILLSVLDAARIADPQSRAAMGIGAFNLVRKNFVAAGGGLEWLRMEVADDAGLGLLVKSRGAGIGILSGRTLLAVDWYPSLRSMMDGVMQRVVMGANYRLWLYLLHCLLAWLCLLAPLGLWLLLWSSTPLAWLCLAIYLLPAIILLTGSRSFALPWAAAWGLPLGFAVVGIGMLRSLWSCLRRGGIYWRGNIYPLGELRAGQRIRMSAFILP